MVSFVICDSTLTHFIRASLSLQLAHPRDTKEQLFPRPLVLSCGGLFHFLSLPPSLSNLPVKVYMKHTGRLFCMYLRCLQET